jgi:Pin2-interacting protein X1
MHATATCNQNHQNNNAKRHLPTTPHLKTTMAYTSLSGSKLRSKMGGVLNESAASHSPALLLSQSSFAKRHLEKMGWTEGTGLGKKRNGVVDHIKIKQREDELGLGREKELAKAVGDVWWKDSLGGTLARLQGMKKSDAKKKKKEKSKHKEALAAKSFTDEELFQATGGARFGMRAQRRAEGKWKRTESGEELAQLEKKAQASMEWNGRGEAKVVVVEESQKRKRHHDNNEQSTTEEGEQQSEKKRLKKLRKEEKKRNKSLHKVSPPPSEEEDAAEKKDKKKKKKSKK